MSNTSSKCWSMSSRRITASACLRVPLVRMSLRPGSFSIAAPSSGLGTSGEWSIWCTNSRIVVRVHAVLGHQPAHRGAVALVIVLLHPERLVLADLEEVRDEGADAVVDLLPEIEVMRIERVVEIEHPGLDMGEARGAARAGAG